MSTLESELVHTREIRRLLAERTKLITQMSDFEATASDPKRTQVGQLTVRTLSPKFPARSRGAVPQDGSPGAHGD